MSCSEGFNRINYFFLDSIINYWSIILCHGGYFACGFFLKDKIIDHKSDHKYVVRKKAGQRQIVKDQSKKIKSSGNIFFINFFSWSSD